MTTTGLIPDGARWVPTGNYTWLKKQVTRAIGMQGICAIDGPWGSGKTSGTTRLLEKQSLPHITIQIDKEAADGELIRMLLLELNLRPVGTAVWEHKMQLAEALAEQEVIIRLIEAQWTPLKFLRRLRTMHDKPTAKWTWLLEGRGIHLRMRQIEELNGRSSFPVTYSHLKSGELDEYLRKYHPLYKSADARLLADIDAELSALKSKKGDQSERGCLRHWAGFTFALLQECADAGIDRQLSPDLASTTLASYAGTSDDEDEDDDAA